MSACCHARERPAGARTRGVGREVAPDGGTLLETPETPRTVAAAAAVGQGKGGAAFALPDGSGRVAVVLGGVAGHGPEVAAQAERLKEALSGCLAEGLPPSEALGFVNAAAEADPAFSGFATAFAATVEPGSGHVEYASAGHDPGLIATPPPPAGGGTSAAAGPSRVTELESTGPPLGVFGADEAEARFARAGASLEPGASLLLFTDGVTEARRRGGDFLGLARLRRWAGRLATVLGPARLPRALLGKVRAFAGRGAPLLDDPVLLVLRRRRLMSARLLTRRRA